MKLVIDIPEDHYEMIQNIPNYISADATQLIRDGIPLPKEDKDKLLIYLTEQINHDVTHCRLRIAKEDGIIEGLQMAAAQIANYVRGQIESEGTDAGSD